MAYCFPDGRVRGVLDDESRVRRGPGAVGLFGDWISIY